ncbi:Uncharacterized protein OBRU01_15178 [Operophtera brumata]|uniref:Ommochrome-binding protein n=1 Tax=Operophtera brumata TaxID=104452 RepID=A0A0L7L5A1_OPEBR|nr:Uncharacterized protein OBRU01_15178 [Operophtera brumata]
MKKPVTLPCEQQTFYNDNTVLLVLLLIANVYGTNFVQLTQNNQVKLNSSFVRIACDGLIFNDVYYEKETLFNRLGKPYNLVMHKYSGVIFFSSTLRNESLLDFGITACHVDKKNCIEISGIPGGYAIAYDSDNDDIYFGGHDGIYKYNFQTDKADFFGEKGKSIWGLFVKNYLYYIEYPSQKLFVYKDKKYVELPQAKNTEVDIFFISKNNDVYFSNNTALMKNERGTKDLLFLDDQLVIRQIAEDEFGDVYFVASDGVYIEDKPYAKIKKIADIDQAFGLTFDVNERVIFSDKDSINRLNPSQYRDKCYNFLIENAEKLKKDPENALKWAKELLRTGYL